MTPNNIEPMKLRECPFCGGEAEFEPFEERHGANVLCKSCKSRSACFDGYYEHSNGEYAKSSKLWNSRPLEDALRKRCEALEKQSDSDYQERVRLHKRLNFYEGTMVMEGWGHLAIPDDDQPIKMPKIQSLSNIFDRIQKLESALWDHHEMMLRISPDYRETEMYLRTIEALRGCEEKEGE